MSLSIKIPWTRLVSAKDPPVLPFNLIKSKLTSFLSRSATAKTASIEISASLLLF